MLTKKLLSLIFRGKYELKLLQSGIQLVWRLFPCKIWFTTKLNMWDRLIVMVLKVSEEMLHKDRRLCPTLNCKFYLLLRAVKCSTLGGTYVDCPWHSLRTYILLIAFLIYILQITIAWWGSIQAPDFSDEEMDEMQPMADVLRSNGKSKDKANKKKTMDDSKGKQRTTKEERLCLMEEKRQQKEVSLVTVGTWFGSKRSFIYMNQLIHMTARKVAKSSA